jgi:hypothetical protein
MAKDPKNKDFSFALSPTSGDTDTNIFGAIAPEEAGKPSTQEVNKTSTQEDGQTSTCLTGKKVKVGYAIDLALVEELRKTVLGLQIEGIKVDRGELVEWGIRKAIKNIKSDGSLKKKLMKR